MADHAILSASSAHRWVLCPISVTAENVEDTNQAAAEGTLAHEIADSVLRGGAWPAVGSKRTLHGFEFEITEDFLRDVNAYVEYVQSRNWVGPYWPETQVNYSHLLMVPYNYAWGTTDCKGIVQESDGSWTLQVIDLKFGRKPVSPDHNPQGLMYAAGAIDELRAVNPLPRNMRVRIAILQPRSSYSAFTWETTVGFVEDYVSSKAPAAQAAVLFYEKRDTVDTQRAFPEVPGEHCHYCKRKTTCAAFKDTARRAANLQPGQFDMQLFKMRDAIKAGLDDLEKLAYDQALTGTPFPGTKLVESRGANPKLLQDEATIIARAAQLQVKVGETKFVMLTPAKIRDAFTKAGMPAEEVQQFVSKPDKGWKITDDSNPLPASNSFIGQDFKGI